jgi:phage-related protein
MATMTSLGFSIFSRYDGDGVRRARRDINDLSHTLERADRTFGGSGKALTAFGVAAAGAAMALNPMGPALAGVAAATAAMGASAGSALGVYGAAMAGAITRTLAMAEAGHKLNPVQRAFVAQVDHMKGSWTRFIKATQGMTLRPVTIALRAVADNMGKFIPLVKAVHPLIMKVAKAFESWMNRSNGLDRFIDTVIKYGVPALRHLINAGRDVLAVLGIGFRTFAPLGVDVAKALERGAAALRGWAEGGGFQRWMSSIKENGPAVKEWFKALGEASAKFGKALAGLGPLAFSLSLALLKIVAALPVPVIQAMVLAWTAWKTVMLGMAVVQVLIAIFGGISAAIGAMSLVMATATFVAAALGLSLGALVAIVAGVIIAIVAIGAAIYLIATRTTWFQTIWKYTWNAVKAVFIAVWTAIKATATAVWTALKATATAIWTALKVTWNAICIAAKAVFTAVWTAIKAVGIAIWNAMKVAFHAVWNGIKAYFTAVLTVYKTVFTTIWRAIKAVGIAIWRSMIALFKTIWNGAKAVWSAVWNACKAIFRTIWNGIKAFAHGVWVGMRNTFKTVWNAAKTIWSAVWTAVRGTFRTIWNGIKAFAHATWNGLKNFAKATWNAMKSTISAVFNAIRTIWRNVWNAIKSFSHALWTGLKNFAKTIWNAMKGAVQAVFNGIKSIWQNIWNAIKNFSHGLWNGLKNFAHGVWNSMKNTVQSVLNGIKNIWTNVWNAIKNFAHGLWDGLKSYANNVWNQMEDRVRAFVNTVKKVWEGIKAAFQGPVNWVIENVINGGIINAVNWVIDKLGGDANTIPDVPTVNLASGGYVRGPGTGTSDSIPARLSDGEYVLNARAVQAIGVDKLNTLNGMRGSGTMSDARTSGPNSVFPAIKGEGLGGVGPQLENSGLVQKFACGSFDIVKAIPDLFKSVAETAAGGAGGVLGGIADALGGAVDSLLPGESDPISDALGGISSFFFDWSEDMFKDGVKGIIESLTENCLPEIPMGNGTLGSLSGLATKEMTKSVLGDFFVDKIATFLFKEKEKAVEKYMAVSVAGSKSCSAWAPMMMLALAKAGAPASWLGGMISLLCAESGGNPNVCNNWDSNAAAGTPSCGLMQTIGPTFQAYCQSGFCSNILDPLSNMMASINYIQAVYGHVPGSPYALGTRGARKGWHMVGERGPEYVQFRGGEKVLPHGEYPPGRDGGGTGDCVITINVQGNMDERAVSKLEHEVLPKMRRMLQQQVGRRA